MHFDFLHAYIVAYMYLVKCFHACAPCCLIVNNKQSLTLFSFLPKAHVDEKKCFLNWNCFQVKVHFVDFGNTEVISLRSIVFLSHDFLSPAPFAQLYCLYGVAVTSQELLVEVHFDLDHCFQLLNIL